MSTEMIVNFQVFSLNHQLLEAVRHR